MPLVLHQRAFLLSACQALVATERVHLSYHLDFIFLFTLGLWWVVSHSTGRSNLSLTNRRAASASATMLLFYLHLGRNEEASKIHHQSVDMPCKTTQTLKHINTHIHNRKREGKPLSTIHLLLASPALTSGLYTTHKQQRKLAGQRAEGTGQRTRQDTQEQALSPPAPLPPALAR
jgi:hypothetical protein